MLAVLLAALGSLEGCKSEKPIPSRSEAALTKGMTLGDILVNSVTQGAGESHLNLSVVGNSLSIGGQRYPKGFGTHAVSRIEISFPPKYQTFAGSCGVDDEVSGAGSVVFKIRHGDKILFESPLIKGRMKAVDFSIPVSGVTTLTLVVEDGGDGIDADHADWVNLSLK